jgi:hypothetical protein
MELPEEDIEALRELVTNGKHVPFDDDAAVERRSRVAPGASL